MKYGFKWAHSDKTRDDEMADSFQNEVPKARINLKLDLHTGGGQQENWASPEITGGGRLQ